MPIKTINASIAGTLLFKVLTCSCVKLAYQSNGDLAISKQKMTNSLFDFRSVVGLSSTHSELSIFPQIIWLRISKILTFNSSILVIKISISDKRVFSSLSSLLNSWRF